MSTEHKQKESKQKEYASPTLTRVGDALEMTLGFIWFYRYDFRRGYR
jgi:hypothetical protein